MKKLLLASLLGLSTFACVTTYAKNNDHSIDQIIAVVNDDVVTRSELNHMMHTVKMQAIEGSALPPEDTLQKQVLDQLINKKLQLQVAKQANTEISDSDINNAVERLAQLNGVTVDALYERINSDGLTTEDYRRDLRDQLTMQKVQQQEVAGKINISPQEINAFLRSKPWQKNSSGEYQLEDILIPLAEAPSPEDIAAAKKRADIVMAKVQQGMNFHEAAQAESGDKTALEGGDLGWRKLPEIPSAFAEKVVHMKAKEIAGPIQTPNGFHIIQLKDVRVAANTQGAPDRKQVEAMLMQRKFEEAVQNWVSKLRSQAFIEKRLG